MTRSHSQAQSLIRSKNNVHGYSVDLFQLLLYIYFVNVTFNLLCSRLCRVKKMAIMSTGILYVSFDVSVFMLALNVMVIQSTLDISKLWGLFLCRLL